MSVNATCGKCDGKLLNDKLEVENGSVQISKCADGHGKIKLPLCFGQDMTCTLENCKFSYDRYFWFFILWNNYNFIVIIVVNFIKQKSQ